jgi:osmotically-inducible protein OsmY
MSDHELEGAVMQALADNPIVHPEEIAAQALDGEVVLRGTVGSLVQRAEAVRTARAVDGVRTVDDQLSARPLGIDGREDADLKAAVIQALVDDDQVNAGDVDVEAREGTVTLRGLVELPSQRDRAERIMLGIGGVEHVVNRLKIWLTVSADDVASRITDAIGSDAVVGIDQIKVSVRDNDVTLTGWVTSPEHRSAALGAASGAPGVADVHDELSVGSRFA